MNRPKKKGQNKKKHPNMIKSKSYGGVLLWIKQEEKTKGIAQNSK